MWIGGFAFIEANLADWRYVLEEENEGTPYMPVQGMNA